MFTLLADAMFTATLNRRGHDIPDRLKKSADRYVPKNERKVHPHNPYRDLW